MPVAKISTVSVSVPPKGAQYKNRAGDTLTVSHVEMRLAPHKTIGLFGRGTPIAAAEPYIVYTNAKFKRDGLKTRLLGDFEGENQSVAEAEHLIVDAPRIHPSHIFQDRRHDEDHPERLVVVENVSLTNTGGAEPSILQRVSYRPAMGGQSQIVDLHVFLRRAQFWGLAYQEIADEVAPRRNH